MIIRNGNQIPLNTLCGTVADVSGALFDTFQPMVFTPITTTVVGFQALETPGPINFQGNWQLLSADELKFKPEGLRDWKWYRVLAQPALVLQVKQIIVYLGVQYRVMNFYDWSLNGYVSYDLIEDYTGGSP